jgi:hypothetical protein
MHPKWKLNYFHFCILHASKWCTVYCGRTTTRPGQQLIDDYLYPVTLRAGVLIIGRSDQLSAWTNGKIHSISRGYTYDSAHASFKAA